MILAVWSFWPHEKVVTDSPTELLGASSETSSETR
jgi:hypothetical protein